MHHYYVIALSALFLLVFAVMIRSLIEHRRISGEVSQRFGGPTGSSQWIWATIPLLILTVVNVALFRGGNEHETSITPNATRTTVSRASAHTPGSPTSLNVALVSSPSVQR